MARSKFGDILVALDLDVWVKGMPGHEGRWGGPGKIVKIAPEGIGVEFYCGGTQVELSREDLRTATTKEVEAAKARRRPILPPRTPEEEAADKAAVEEFIDNFSNVIKTVIKHDKERSA